MTIHLPAELEEYVYEEVRAGRYPSEDAVIRDALEQSRSGRACTLPRPGVFAVAMVMRDDADLSGRAGEDVIGGSRPRLTEAEFKQYSLKSGRISSLPVPADPAARRISLLSRDGASS